MLCLNTFAASCKGRLKKQRQRKHLPNAGSQITSTIAAISASALVIASAGFGAMYAWAAGLPYGPALASLSVLMAVALEVAKPLSVAGVFAAFRSWAVVRGLALSLLATVAVV